MMTEQRTAPTYRVTRNADAAPYCSGLATAAEAVRLCDYMNVLAFSEPFVVMPDPPSSDRDFFMSRRGR